MRHIQTRVILLYSLGHQIYKFTKKHLSKILFKSFPELTLKAVPEFEEKKVATIFCIKHPLTQVPNSLYLIQGVKHAIK